MGLFFNREVEDYCESHGCNEMEAANQLGLNLDEICDIPETDDPVADMDKLFFNN